MSQHIQHEMTSCLTEMQRLQEKMEKLQQEKIIQEQQQKEKTNEIEPNLDVMEKWIKSIAKIKDEYTIEQKVKRLTLANKYAEWSEGCRRNINQYEIEIFQKWTEIQQRRRTPRRIGEQQGT